MRMDSAGARHLTSASFAGTLPMPYNFSLTDLFPDAPEISIVDVGASLLGDEVEPYTRLVERKLARLTGFEPNAEECAKLKARHGAGCTFLPYFVGRGGPATFHEGASVYTGSLYEPNMALLGRFQ